ncbi:MAG: cbb3-type cytochrome c oxidase subunit I, partial [Pseudomonadota bacterium]
MTTATKKGGGVIEMLLLSAGSFIALYAASQARDDVYFVHMLIFAAAGLFFIWRALSVEREVPTEASYMDGVVRAGVIATVFWGVVGFLVGLVIALQLAYPQLNFDLPWTTFGRLRPLHTSAVIFAFGGNALLCTSFYVVQRTTGARLALGNLAWFVFWGYQLFIVLAATGYVLGGTQGKEYAEPEWYVDLWLTVVWVAYLLVFMGTIMKRKEPHIYVANWFYLSFIITVAMLHVVNAASVPVSVFGAKSYSLFSGVQDALTQWWYGHNAVGFFLTAGFLGMMYYFVPKQADRP